MMPKAYMTRELPELSIQSESFRSVCEGWSFAIPTTKGKQVAVTQCMAHISNVDRLDFEVHHSLSDGYTVFVVCPTMYSL